MLIDNQGVEIRRNRGHTVRGISPEQYERMFEFLKGAVRTRCADYRDKQFAARDMLGGVNFDWRGTPLQALYDKYIDEGYSDAEAIKRAGISAGHILKRVLILDEHRIFQLGDAGKANGYTWVGNTTTH